MVYGYWLAAILAAGAAWGQAPSQFKSGVEMLAVDVQVVGADGEPVLGLMRTVHRQIAAVCAV